MTISNINIFGFGPLSDRTISLTGGENRADTGENSEISEDKAIGAFITAIFCGFREDIAAREPERKWEAAALLPSRAEYRPENGEFGGELADRLEFLPPFDDDVKIPHPVVFQKGIERYF